MKPGFTLIEVLVFIVIAGMMSIALYQGLNQTNRVVQYVDSMVSLDQRIFIVQDRLEKDIAGAFIPAHLPPEKQQKQVPAGAQKEQTKILPKLFYGVSTEKNLQELTFITTNPLQVYGAQQPRIARVQYKLTPDKGHKNAFKLTRQESLVLFYDKFQETNPREYVLADNIKTIMVEYGVIEKDKDKKESITASTQWNSDDRKSTDKDKDKKKRSLLPSFVRMTIELWNNKGDQSISYENIFPIYGDTHLAQNKTQEVQIETMPFNTRNSPNINSFLDKYDQYKRQGIGG